MHNMNGNAPTPDNVDSLLTSLRSTPPRLIQSPATQPRRASVALIIRLRPPADFPRPDVSAASNNNDGAAQDGEASPEDDFRKPISLEDFFAQPWTNHSDTVPELLFIRRIARPSDRFSSHVAFPGGRQEEGDKGDGMYTALRETWEETGLDLAEPDYIHVGRLDDREITTSLGKRLLMILSPFVFLQTSLESPRPDLQPQEISSLHWIPLSLLSPPYARDAWSEVEIDISSRLSPRNRLVRMILKGLVGNMKFGSLLLPDEPDTVAEGFVPEFADEKLSRAWGGGTLLGKDGRRQLRLWGLTLGMTLDLLAHLPSPEPPTPASRSRNPSFTNLDLLSDEATSTPRTPVTVTSSFDASFARTAHENNAEASSSRLSRSSGSSSAKGKGRSTDVVVSGMTEVKVAVQEKVVTAISGDRLPVRRRGVGVGPGMTSVFPRFTYPDVNFWIWVFGRRYRAIVRGWEASIKGPIRASDRRINWSGAALSSFYSAVRQALLVAIIIRGIATGIGLAGIAWYLWRKWAAS